MVVIRRKVRENRKSSDEYDSETGTSTVWFHHASKDSYRVVAGLDYACSWPYDTEKPVSSNTKEIIDLVRSDYENVLSRYEISLQSEELQSISRRYHNNYTDFLLIMSNDEDVSKWCDAADEIQAIIDEAVRRHTPINSPERPNVHSDLDEFPDLDWENKPYSICVEIRNPLKFYCDSSGGIPFGRPNRERGTRALEKTQDIVAEKARSLCGEQNLSSISWIPRARVGIASDAEAMPTVMIGVKPNARRNWAEIEEELCKAIEGVLDDGDADVAVEIGPGWIQQGIHLDPRSLG